MTYDDGDERWYKMRDKQYVLLDDYGPEIIGRRLCVEWVIPATHPSHPQQITAAAATAAAAAAAAAQQAAATAAAAAAATSESNAGDASASSVAGEAAAEGSGGNVIISSSDVSGGANPSPPPSLPPTNTGAASPGVARLGSSVPVRRWYEATVTGFEPELDMHHLVYDGGKGETSEFANIHAR